MALARGQAEECMRLFREIPVIDPLNADTYLELSIPLLRLGRFADAAEEARRGLAITPTYVSGHLYLGEALLADGKLVEARRTIDLERPEGGPQAGLAMVHFALGRKRESAAALARFVQDHGSDSAFNVAEAYAYVDNKDRALEWLERAYRQKDAGVRYLKGDWFMRGLEPDPGFRAVLQRMNLPD